MDRRAADDQRWLADRFEADRPRLRAVAYRMLGSGADADDAVQETWLRLARSGPGGIENVGGWLTTVLSRVCLDVLRTRASRRDGAMDADKPGVAADPSDGSDPERDAVMAESVGLALLVVLQELSPHERVAFVLHDLFDVPFDLVAEVVGRSPAAVRQLASRARRRVRGTGPSDTTRLRDRAVADAFLAASRDGDVEGLLAVLAPDVVFRADATAVAMGGPAEVRGAAAVARAFVGRAAGARVARVDDGVGLVVQADGRLRLVLRLTVTDDRIAEVEVVADPDRLRDLSVVVLDN